MKRSAEREAMIDKAVAQMTPEKLRALVDFSIEVGIAAVIAGLNYDEPIPDFIYRIAKKARRRCPKY